VRRVPVQVVSTGPVPAAQGAVAAMEASYDRYLVHLDVDVIDFTDAPLSENTGRGIGLPFETALAALDALVASDRLAALTVTELNPQHAAADDGLLERFASSLAAALS
jgi:arginase